MSDQPLEGVSLPDIDPNIAEAAYAALVANPESHPSDVATALALQAPSPDVAAEMVRAVFEIVLCGKKGDLLWVEETAAAILTGIRRVPGREAMRFGHARWPLRALAAGPPTAVTVQTSSGPRWAYIAADMRGVVLRMTEAHAIGEAVVERLGGRVIEDRHGAEAFEAWGMERRVTRRAKLRGEAMSAAYRMTVEARVRAPSDVVGLPAAEAIDGLLRVGDVLHPEGNPLCRYTVTRRVNESWVLLSPTDTGPTMLVEPGAAWVLSTNHATRCSMPHAAFTEEPSVTSVEDVPPPEVEDAAPVAPKPPPPLRLIIP